MKLLVSHLEALRGYVSREFYCVMTELITQYGWRHIETQQLSTAPGPVENTLRQQFGQLPEVILFWEAYEFLSGHAHEIQRLNTQKVIFADDLHWLDEPMRRRKVVGFALCDTVLATYAYAWDRFYPEFCRTKRVEWVPHSASPDFVLRYNERPENSIFLSGRIDHHYPLRQTMKSLCDGRRYSITYHHHPGYHCSYDYERDRVIGRGYAELINKHRAAFTDSLKYKYVVAKYFEIPATGALLVADAAVREPLRRLGFMEHKHYLPVSQENLEETVRYVLHEPNHRELDEIRTRASSLVWRQHTTSHRARRINELCAA